MSTNIGTAELEIIPTARGFSNKLESQLNGEMPKAGRRAGEHFSSGFSHSAKHLAGGLLVGFGIGEGVEALKGFNEEARKAQKTTALTDAVLKSTGGVAGVTAEEVEHLSHSIGEKVGVDHDAIQSGANMILTFKNIRNEAGKGNNIFDQTVQTVTDVAAAMAAASHGQLNFRSTSIQLGKALNDPVKGITALTRIGVTFSAGQKKRIKNLVAEGKSMQAQKLILRELKSEFGGAAASQATESEKTRVKVDELKESIGKGLLPVEDKLLKLTSDEIVPAISNFVQGMHDGTGAGGEFADVLNEAYTVGKGVVGFLNGLPGPVKKFAVQGLIAAFVLSKINSGFTAIGRSGVGTFVSGMSKAETRMETASNAGYKLGGALRQAGGVAGALALVNGLHRLNQQTSDSQRGLGALETTAGAAAVGFAAGGPLGAAIAGTAAGAYSLVHVFGLFGTAVKKNEGPFKISKATLDAYAGTLDEVSGAATAATRAMVLQNLEQSGMLDSTRKLGLSDREAVNAMTGNIAARSKLSRLLSTSTALTNKQKDALRTETGAVGAARLEQLRHNVAIANSATDLKRAKTALAKFMNAPASKKVAITGVEDVTTSLSNIKSALDQVFGRSADLHLSGQGLGGLLHVEGAGATGAIVKRPTLALIGESGPEALVPLNRTRGNEALPPAATVGSGGSGLAGQRLALVVNGQLIEGVIADIADTRVGAQRALDGMQGRAFG